MCVLQYFNTKLYQFPEDYLSIIPARCFTYVSSDLDSRQTLSQREKELVDSADKCREAMENQMADLRKQSSSLAQEMVSAKDENKSLQQQLRDKVSVTYR